MKKFDFKQYSMWIGLLASLVTSFLFTPTSWWPLVIFAGMLGGFTSRKIGKSVLSSGLGVLLGWGISILIKVLTQNTHILIDQIASILFGAEGFGPLIITGVLFIGIFLGILGGIIGNAIRIWTIPNSEKQA